MNLALFREQLKKEKNEVIFQNQSEICVLCHMPVIETDLMSCNHPIHRECLMENIKRTESITCPYCRQDSGFDIRGNSKSKATCQYIMKKGIRKGEECGKTVCILGKNRCKLHIDK